ncbi:MAG TPA: sigma-70 family RNA polymerase sigma factor [Solirubrobacteraceae bacterium]
MEASALQAPVGIGRLSLGSPLLRLRSDEQLVALFRAGNEEAFRVIHDRYRQRLFAYARQMLGGSRQDAEDALQDVFIRAYGALRANDREIALRGWLYRVAHNRCIDQLRRPMPPAVDLFDITRVPAADPCVETERREALRRLVADVQRLPEQQRSVLLMRELEGLSYAELADTHCVTVPAVKSLLVRARMGLVEAAEARDTDCADIRAELSLSQGRGVRATGRARRHLRDCSGCREYRTEIRRVKRSFAALTPVAPLAFLTKLGLTGGGGSAAGGGAAAASGGAAAGGGVLGGSAVALTATKVAVVVCSVVVSAGGAVTVEQQLDQTASSRVTPAVVAPQSDAVSPAAVAKLQAPVAKPVPKPAPVTATKPVTAPAPPTGTPVTSDQTHTTTGQPDVAGSSGGTVAPDDSAIPPPSSDATPATIAPHPPVDAIETPPTSHTGAGATTSASTATS